MEEKAFSTITVPDRPGKPRQAGITMLIDWGLGLAAQADWLEIGAEYIDLAKIAVGVSRLLPADLLRHKLDLYREHEVLPFPGGQFLEYAVHHGQTEEYLAAACAAGYQWIEVSDNVLEISLEQKVDLIRLAREGYGLGVIGEVGSKVTGSDSDRLVADIETCLEAGCWKVFVEAVELFDTVPNEALIEAIATAVPLERLIFEIPGPWNPGVRQCDGHMLRTWLIQRFGPLVNLANVPPEEVIAVETARRGIGVSALRW
jgi:phosphosulfolactate synthase